MNERHGNRMIGREVRALGVKLYGVSKWKKPLANLAGFERGRSEDAAKYPDKMISEAFDAGLRKNAMIGKAGEIILRAIREKCKCKRIHIAQAALKAQSDLRAAGIISIDQ